MFIEIPGVLKSYNDEDVFWLAIVSYIIPMV